MKRENYITILEIKILEKWLKEVDEKVKYYENKIIYSTFKDVEQKNPYICTNIASKFYAYNDTLYKLKELKERDRHRRGGNIDS